MTSISMTTLFTTIAQVSFTLTGLLAVAVAGDKENRTYWFGKKTRSLIVYSCFLLVVLPGFVSIGSLIPSIPPYLVLGWPFSTIILGVAYFIISFVFPSKKKSYAEPQEIRRLEKTFVQNINNIRVYSILMVVIAIIEYTLLYSFNMTNNLQILESLLGILLFLSIFTGALNSYKLLSSNELLSKISEGTVINNSSEMLDVSPPKKNSKFLTPLIIAIIVCIGLLVKRKGK